jgi:L-rhamnose-H+ transport protein
MPPLLSGQALGLFTTRSGILMTLGILVALMGIAVVSVAGYQKEKALGATAEQFDLRKGLALAVMCGVFSSGMSFAIVAAKPIEAAAIGLGVNHLYAALPSYVIIMGGGALVNFAYCAWGLMFRRGLSLKADMGQRTGTLLKNTGLAAAGGIMWYLQFFFYAWGAANIPQSLSYVNWMLHMSGYVLCGGLVGLALGEWTGVGNRAIRVLWIGMILIIIAANVVGLSMAS